MAVVSGLTAQEEQGILFPFMDKVTESQIQNLAQSQVVI